MKLHGWARLWVVLVITWGIICLFTCIFIINNLSSPTSLRIYATQASCNRVVDGNYLRLLDLYTEPKIVAAAIAHAGNTVDAREAIQECAEAIQRNYDVEYADTRRHYIVVCLLVFLVPAIAILALGLGVAWVRRGFIKV